MEHMIKIRNTLLECISKKFESGTSHVNTEEMGYAMDMLKDIEMAMYYETVTNAMHDAEPETVAMMSAKYR